MWESISKSISDSIGEDLIIHNYKSISGGCINEAFCVETERGNYFVKRHQEVMVPMFQAEFEALRELEATQTIQVPAPICWGVGQGFSWLVTTFLNLEPCSTDSSYELGKQLACLHKIEKPNFGWHRDNTIGSTKQPNPPSKDWISFWRQYRLEWQLKLAREKGQSFNGADFLLNNLDGLFEDYHPQPALLHGDLWNGNVASLNGGSPIIFDPASYYGDPEAEFGIIEMFGGFGPAFYQGYESVRPLGDGFSKRLPLYRLYHELNHFNLFGPTYFSSCQSSIQQLLKAL